MALKHFQPVGLGQRMPARIITVDKPRRRLEAALKDGGMVYVSIIHIGPVFRMPKTGEVWMIRKDGGIWELDSPIDVAAQSHTGEDTGEENIAIEDLGEGQVRIDANPSETGSGVWVGNAQVTLDNDFPTWTPWTPDLSGWSANPLGGVYRYTQIGKTIICMIRQPNNGISDNATTTISLPIPAVTLTDGVWIATGVVVDNNIASQGLARIVSAGSTVSFGITPIAVADFTASGNKRIATCTIVYEIT